MVYPSCLMTYPREDNLSTRVFHVDHEYAIDLSALWILIKLRFKMRILIIVRSPYGIPRKSLWVNIFIKTSMMPVYEYKNTVN